MKQSAKDRIFDQFLRLSAVKQQLTAEELAEQSGISRQNASHYLTRLMEEGKVLKISGKPVLWQAADEFSLASRNSGDEAFRQVVGYDGSLKEVVQKCIAAVKYPPDGLSLLLNGDSGVGKSFLAHQVYTYAIAEGVILSDAPFVILNCADYADNPELLSATLFGYKKGAFTGAEKDTPGLLANADGGYLLLDEIHRLSKENQEKLFLFMDNGHYRPVGENSRWSQARVRFIFATTEKNEDFLLDTFARRIQVQIKLPAFEERPLSERLELIRLFFQNEADILQRDIKVTKEVLSFLLMGSFKGNIGRLKNLIKISCADVYSRGLSEPLPVGIDELAIQLDAQSAAFPLLPLEDELIQKDRPLEHRRNRLADYDRILQRVTDLGTQGNFSDKLPEIKKEVQRLVKVMDENTYLSRSQKLMVGMYRQLWATVLEKKYGLTTSGPAGEITSRVYVALQEYKTELADTIRAAEQVLPRTAYVSDRFLEQLPCGGAQEKHLLRLVIMIILSDYVDETIELKGLLLAHGDSTASSIQSVVNQLCGNYLFEALDMPVESNVSEIVESTRRFVQQQVHSDSLVLIVDMGSLNQIYTQIKNDLKGELLLLNNLTTSIALDIGLKMSVNASFDRIAEDAADKYAINVQYFEGFSQTKNIIISCMSGLGISDKLKEIFSRHLATERVEVYTKEYRELRSLIDQNDEDYFDKTKLVITTSDLPRSFTIPNVNVYDILDGEGSRYLENVLADEMDHQQFLSLIQELVKFFSLEGIVDRLNFLNPTIVMSEVETVISKYENYYHFSLNGRVKLNLYMHTALMMERLFLARTEKSDEPQHQLAAEEDEFYYVSRSIFQSMEMKYNFKVNAYELSLLYELLGSFIRK